MQTKLADFIRDTPEGREADAILRKCVHCGFCTATCPTYQLLGDELDGPRGRIYLMKSVLEGDRVTEKTQTHLDRCLTCRSCETTCPSGVEYGRLLDIVRNLVEQRVERPWWQRAQRAALTSVLPRPSLFSPLLGLGRMAKPYLPNALGGKVPASLPDGGRWPALRHRRRMIALAGCVQPALAPDINAAAARVLDRLGVSLVEARGAGCCGAVRYHLSQQREGLEDMRRLIDVWWPHIEAGAETIVMTGSGCGAMVREFAHLFRSDARYREKAERISAMTRDICEVIDAEIERLKPLLSNVPARRVAYHSPCTLQHAQKIRGVTERVLAATGFELTAVPDAHLCCGSAGTYSILQPELAEQLKANKLAALASGMPELILSSNIGCQTHLAAGAQVRVTHWIVALDEQLAHGAAAP